MGLAKKLSNSRTSFSTDSVGTPGWQAPEMFNDTFKTTKKVNTLTLPLPAQQSIHPPSTLPRHPFSCLPLFRLISLLLVVLPIISSPGPIPMVIHIKGK